MTKLKLLYIVLGIHLLCGILGLLIICSVPETDHMRWNIGYIIGWIFVLSSVFSVFIHIPNKVPKGVKYAMRIYRGVCLLSFIIGTLLSTKNRE